MEVGDLPVVENVACRWLVECGLVVENFLLQVMELVLILFHEYGSVSLAIGDGLKEAVSNTPEEDHVQVQVGLEGRLDGVGGKSDWCWGCDEPRR
jgi:hypothetical protein